MVPVRKRLSSKITFFKVNTRILAYAIIILSVVYFYKAEAAEMNWQCASDELFQSRYKNAGLDPFMDGVLSETKLNITYSEEDNVLTINEDDLKPRVFSSSEPYVHLAVGKSEKGVHLITANRVMSSFLMIKKPESEGYMAINKSLEIEGNPDKPVIREWTQIFLCE